VETVVQIIETYVRNEKERNEIEVEQNREQRTERETGRAMRERERERERYVEPGCVVGDRIVFVDLMMMDM